MSSEPICRYARSRQPRCASSVTGRTIASAAPRASEPSVSAIASSSSRRARMHGHVALEDREQQIVATAEVVLHRRRVALTRLAHDLGERHGVDAALGEQPRRGIDQLVASRRLGLRHATVTVATAADPSREVPIVTISLDAATTLVQVDRGAGPVDRRRARRRRRPAARIRTTIRRPARCRPRCRSRARPRSTPRSTRPAPRCRRGRRCRSPSASRVLLRLADLLERDRARGGRDQRARQRHAGERARLRRVRGVVDALLRGLGRQARRPGRSGLRAPTTSTTCCPSRTASSPRSCRGTVR